MTPAELGFDPDALRERYRQERDRRIRPEGNDQYVEVTGEFGRYLDDPYVEPGFTRAPLHDEVEVLVIGGGFGGLLIAAYLQRAGLGTETIGRFNALERADAQRRFVDDLVGRFAQSRAA